jgi:hypothetical protein
MAAKTVVQRLRCKLDARERLTKVDELTRLMGELDEAERAKAAATQRFGTLIKELKMRVTEVAFDVRDETEVRPVECVERGNFANLTVELVRTDTREVVSTRAMSDAERQGDLAFGAAS